MGVAPQLTWRLIIKANSGLSASWPHRAQGTRLGPTLVGLLNTMGKGAVVGLNKFRKESCLDFLNGSTENVHMHLDMHPN